MSTDFHFMVRRKSDGLWLTWNGWGHSVWASHAAGQYPDDQTAIRDGKLEAPGNFEVVKQAGSLRFRSDDPTEVVYTDQQQDHGP